MQLQGSVSIFESISMYHALLMSECLCVQSLSEGSVSIDCDPLVKNGSALLNPCGLVANSFFTDMISYNSGSMDSSSIAWKSDSSRFQQVAGFKSKQITGVAHINTTYCAGQLDELGDKGGVGVYPYNGLPNTAGELWCYYYPDEPSTQYLYETYPEQISPIDGVTDQHFMVWMRTAGLPTFRKLYGKIDGNFKSGDVLSFSVIANFEVNSFNAGKGLTLSTLGEMGGKNPFLGIAYIVVGTISLLLAILFAVKYFVDPRKQGTADYLHWE